MKKQSTRVILAFVLLFFLAVSIFLVSCITVSGTDEIKYSGNLSREDVLGKWSSLPISDRHLVIGEIVGENIIIEPLNSGKKAISSNSLLYGLSRKQVISDLGQPNGQRDSAIDYELAVLPKKTLGDVVSEAVAPGFSPHANWFVIHFDDNDIATHYEISD